jgi:prolycopene isomerase
VRAPHVVSNADLRLTLEEMLGSHVGDTDHLRRARRLRPTSPCYLVHIGLREVTLDDLRKASGYHWRSWDPDRVTEDAFKIFIPTMYEPRMAPAGGQILILQRIMELDYGRVTDWEAHKRSVEADLLERLEAVIPGIGTHMVTVQTASALTAWRYTRNHRGAMLGWEMSPEQLGDGRPAIEGPVRNLYFTGHWTRPGGGITPVIVSAMEVARAITGSSG